MGPFVELGLLLFEYMWLIGLPVCPVQWMYTLAIAVKVREGCALNSSLVRPSPIWVDPKKLRLQRLTQGPTWHGME
jgi:hypothetical protein